MVATIRRLQQVGNMEDSMCPHRSYFTGLRLLVSFFSQKEILQKGLSGPTILKPYIISLFVSLVGKLILCF
jgi:hypothetical protein